MDIKVAKRMEQFGGTTCVYWLAGKCIRNPCKFLHKESPLPLPYTTYHYVKRSNTPYRYVRRAHLYQNTSKVTLNRKSAEKEGGTSVVKTCQKTQFICKYWTNGNCVHGERCQNLHSWFHGDGFSTLAKLEGHKKVITGIALPIGSDKLYSGSTDGTVQIWDCHTGQSVNVINLGAKVTSLINEGPWIFVGVQNAIKAWNIQTPLEFTLDGPKGQVLAMVVVNDTLFAGAKDGIIYAWRGSSSSKATTPFEPVASLIGHSKAVVCLTVGANMLF